ncbi:Sec1 family protein [Dictyocaulus viviparus]|uniref:Sec1 family protein n=1 Tax=Dictyocaulus viviparus TaxID=29172 RepID=A0A0D8YEQ7_DICVI|nr:Sec1 family protein [Dictyocaulus viviparus]
MRAFLRNMSYQPDIPQLETIRTKQIAALRNIMNLNQPITNTMMMEPVWKILIIDKLGQDIISPLLSIKVLRDLGVTLHLLIGSKREPLTDVPVVYFISPSEENIDLLCDDLKNAMYSSFYINLISPLPRARLENLASAAVQGGTDGQVQKVVDQYLNFISLEDDLFVLRRYNEYSPMSYFAINDPSISDNQMSAFIDSVADGLFAVCATMGIVPIIRCPKDNAAELVAKRLDQKLRDNLRDARNNLFTVESVRAGQLNATRPLLLIADRSIDLATMLHHTWTYQALIHDILELDQNRVVITEKNGKKKEYDLSSGGTDKLWTKHKGSAFPLVAEAIQEDLEIYRSSEDEIKRLKHAMGMEGNDADEAMTSILSNTTAKLGSTVTSLSQLLEAKRLIDLHTNVATTLLDYIKLRKLDVLFELEQKVLQRSALEMPLLQFLSDISNPEDVLRVILINYLCQENMSKPELEEQLVFLRERAIDESAVRFVQKMRSVSQLGKTAPEEHQGAGTKTINMFNKLLSHSSRFVMEGVKNLVPKKHNLPLTRLLDTLVTPPSSSTVGINQMMGASQSNEGIELCYLDPKVMHAMSRDTSNAIRTRQTPPQDVILFVIGGGNYVEYQNLVDYGRSKGLQRVTYGCTELVNPRQFTDQYIFCYDIMLVDSTDLLDYTLLTYITTAAHY